MKKKHCSDRTSYFYQSTSPATSRLKTDFPDNCHTMTVLLNEIGDYSTNESQQLSFYP